MRKLFLFLVFILLFVGYFHEITAMTQDLGRHLIMGKIITQSLSVPTINLFSYTYPDYPFINHHWLSEVIFYNIFHRAGFLGLLLFTTSLVLIGFFLIIKTTLKETNIFVVAASSLLYFNVLFERTDLRPEIFSFFFLSLFIVILYRFREGFTKWIFLLPLLELLWVNMHIYFIIGIGVLGLFLIDWFVINLKKPYSKYTSILVFVFFFCLLATFINPNGVSGALYPFHVFQNYGYAIEENQTIFFLWNYSQKPTIAYFMLTVTMLFLSLIFTIKKARVIDWLLAISFTILAAFAIRNFPLFVLATFIPFCRSLTIVAKNIYTIVKKDLSPKRLPLGQRIFQATLLIVFLWQIVSTMTTEHFGYQVTTGGEKGADFFIQHNIKGPIFNNFDIGSYLDYRLYPKDLPVGRQGVVFVDGRPEAYPASFFEETYIPMQEDIAKFDQQAKKYNFNSIFFAHTDQTPWAERFLRQALNSVEWKPVYLDDRIIILVKNRKENKLLIEQFGMQKEKLHITNYQPKDFDSLLQLAHFLTIANEKQQAIKVFHDILALDPKFCPGLYNLSVLNREHPAIAAVYSNQFLAHCQ